jgi:hypothetical protein
MTVNDDSLFAKPAAEWTDDELRVGLPELGQRIAELREAGHVQVANRLTELAADLADERDQRRALHREVEDAMVTVTDLGILPDDEPADPGRDERLSVAVAEWQQGRATPVMVRLKIGGEAPFALCCPARHTTSLELLETTAGRLLVARAIDPHPGVPPRIEYATLLDHDGTYEGQCARCERRFILDVGQVRRDVAAGRRKYIARDML